MKCQCGTTAKWDVGSGSGLGSGRRWRRWTDVLHGAQVQQKKVVRVHIHRLINESVYVHHAWTALQGRPEGRGDILASQV